MRKSTLAARRAALVGILAAMLECIKLALAWAPNIEALTLFCALFGYCFGGLGVIAAVIFVMLEPLLWGFGSWVISYILYWPAVAIVFAFLRRFGGGGRVVPTVIAVLMTLWFGILSSLVEVGLFSGSFDNFFSRFIIYYSRGIVFYALQLASNLVLFPLLFPYLARKLTELSRQLI